MSSHLRTSHLPVIRPSVPGRSGDCPGCRGGGKGATKGPTRGPPFARCTFGVLGLKVEDGPAARLQGAGDVRQVWPEGSPRGEGSGMPADSTPASGRVLSVASMRQGVWVKPWEKALVQGLQWRFKAPSPSSRRLECGVKSARDSSKKYAELAKYDFFFSPLWAKLRPGIA